MSEHRSDYLQHLKGKCVALTFEDEKVEVEAVDGWTLHIYNACTLSGDVRARSVGRSLLRLELLDFLFDDLGMTIIFSGETYVTVDLTEGGCSGPEAMQLNGPDGTIVVWS